MTLRSAVLGGLLALLLAAPGRSQDAGGVVISEVMAFASKGLQDADGENSDWIEVFNRSAEAVDLAGWVLTDSIDNPFQWVFPEGVEIGPGQFLVVFASGKNRTDPAGELHTNFSLERDGEFLALLNPAGDIVSGFIPRFPWQALDASYGMATDSTFERPLVAGAPARALIPENDDLGLSWTELEFDDGGWREGTTAVGFGGPAANEDRLGLDVAEMRNVNASVYIRIPFTVEDPTTADIVRLHLEYDDGLVVYINGVRVAEANIPDPVTWNSEALRSHSASLETVDISVHKDALRAGENVLAIHGLNTSVSNSDVFMLPELELIDVGEVLPDVLLYFDEPSPGLPNGQGFPAIAPRPTFSHESQAFTEPTMVEISTELDGGVIRYERDGSVPTADSPVYDGPIEVTQVARITARVFKDGLLPSIPESRTYLLLHPSLSNFTSNLPLVVCATLGRPIGGNCGGGPYTPAHVMIISPGEDGVARITGEAAVSNAGGVRKRGSSTCGRPKFSFNVEFWDDELPSAQDTCDTSGPDKPVQVLDFPIDSDYIMYGPYNFDRGLMRNPIAYWMSREVGRWAARSRFVECFFHQSNGPVTNASYFGVYALMEKNKRDDAKIDVELLTAQDNEPPMVEGGYILKRDRVGQGEQVTNAGGYGSLVFVYPKCPTPAQRAYITNYINRAIGSLGPHIGSQDDSDLIDVMEFIDHHILTWYPKNVDAFRLSGYFFKRRDGLLAMGPVWDYDRTMGCADDDRARSPTGWDNDNVGDGGTRYFQAGGLGSWYSHLFQNRPPTGNDPWATAYRARWRELRRGPLRTENILGQIDTWAEELISGGAAERNFTKWSGVRYRFGSFQGEVNHLKNWLAQRADWIDAQFVATPYFDPGGGLVERGSQVEILVDSESPIYYTDDSTDPRGAGDEPSPSAKLYEGPITIERNTRLTARTFEGGGLWSGDVSASFAVEIPRLVVTEIMYNPPPDPDGAFSTSDFEFFELQNAGDDEAIDLEGISIGTRSRFEFPEGVLPLGPGEFVVVVRNRQAFESRYGSSGIRVAGEFSGLLSNVAQQIQVLGPIGESILDFEYDDGWYPETDGDGYSLVIRDSRAPTESWNDSASWRASVAVGGSPGREDTEPGEGLQRPGDVSQDGKLGIADAVGLLRYLFQGAQNLPCIGKDANQVLLDVNGDQTLNVSDVLFSLQYMFQRGAPPVPGTDCMPIFGCPEVCGGAD